MAARAPVRRKLEREPAPRLGRLFQRAALRATVLVRVAARALQLLPRGSRLRLLALSQLGYTSMASFARDEVDALLLMYTPDTEMRPAYEMGPLGFDELYRGREGISEFSRRWSEEWGRVEMRPTELFDGGDTIVLRYRMDVEGRGSGVMTGQDAIFVFRLKGRDGRVAWSSFFIDPAGAARAAGFPV